LSTTIEQPNLTRDARGETQRCDGEYCSTNERVQLSVCYAAVPLCNGGRDLLHSSQLSTATRASGASGTSLCGIAQLLLRIWCKDEHFGARPEHLLRVTHDAWIGSLQLVR